MFDWWQRLRRNLLRTALLGALVIGAASGALAQDPMFDPGVGRPIPGAPPGTIDVAEWVGGVTSTPPGADAPDPITVGLPVNLECGAMTPFMVSALAAGMLLMYVPVRRIRSWRR